MDRSKMFCTSALLTFRNSCLLSLTLTTMKNCSIACSTRSFMYFLGSMGRLTEAPTDIHIKVVVSMCTCTQLLVAQFSYKHSVVWTLMYLTMNYPLPKNFAGKKRYEVTCFSQQKFFGIKTVYMELNNDPTVSDYRGMTYYFRSSNYPPHTTKTLCTK